MMLVTLATLLAFLDLRAPGATVCVRDVNIGFDVKIALLELSDPLVSVFCDTAFPNGDIPKQATAATTYVKRYIKTGSDTLTVAVVSASDLASLGVAAILLGQSDSSTYSAATTRQVNELLNNSDFIYMVPPTLAKQGVAVKNETLIGESVKQILLYRDALQDRSTGLWRHVVGSRTDAGSWSTGNGWALGGIAPVLATIQHWPTSSGWTAEQQQLTSYAKEIIDGAIRIGPEGRSGLLRNYISNASTLLEAAGTAMTMVNVYRIAVLAPNVFARSQYLAWAGARRADVVKAVGPNSTLCPAINPYKYTETSPYDNTSPEAQSFAVLLYATYRDCICAGYCKA
ncbi:hypothetical protein EK21DRAFT_99014 [Setomelanomma holmii]|uniref:Uncharacterized protein n=1 Tax=Setomelanomma holmii TaxID=210430 RepID=A0A9P4LM85_9PLEO|nr:hypothetical protein EK21DRAFT_99014 [Setomelanomma holmii]